MTHGYGPQAQPERYSEKVLSNQEAEDCLIPMGITSETAALLARLLALGVTAKCPVIFPFLFFSTLFLTTSLLSTGALTLFFVISPAARARFRHGALPL